MTNISKDKIYTNYSLLDDIMNQSDSDEMMQSCNKDDSRERRFRLKLLQTICTICDDDYSDKIDKDEIIHFLEAKIEEEELLYGYTFFLASKQNFCYNWSYLRKQIDNYICFLTDAYIFVNKIVSAINWLISQRTKYKELEFEFNDLFHIKYIDAAPYVRVAFNWENFNSISHLKDKDSYTISIVKNNVVLLTYACKYDKGDIGEVMGKCKLMEKIIK